MVRASMGPTAARARWDAASIRSTPAPGTCDVIVVLGCRVVPSGALSRLARQRTLTAARAWLDRVAPAVLASGGRRWGSHVEARRMKRELVAAGVPEGAIVEELCSLSTCE